MKYKAVWSCSFYRNNVQSQNILRRTLEGPFPANAALWYQKIALFRSCQKDEPNDEPKQGGD